METPTSMINHLVRYITDDSTIAAFVKREFGREVDRADVAKARHIMWQPRVAKIEPLYTKEDEQWREQARLSSMRMRERLENRHG